MGKLYEACVQFIDALHEEGYIDKNDPNFHMTPNRMSLMYKEFLQGAKNTEYEIGKFFMKSFPSKYRGMIISKNIEVVGICPHHFLPVQYKIDIGYIPKKEVIGVSKLHRVCKLLAARAVLQEDLTSDIIEYFNSMLQPEGVIVIVEGIHGCMACRGIRQENPIVTSELSGIFQDHQVKQEFLNLIERR